MYESPETLTGTVVCPRQMMCFVIESELDLILSSVFFIARMLQQVASHCCYVIVAIPMYERGNERDSERDKIKGKRECCDIFWFTHCGMLFHKRPLAR